MKQLENCLVVANGIGYVVSQSCYGVFPQMYKEIILIVSAVFGPCFRLCFRFYCRFPIGYFTPGCWFLIYIYLGHVA